MLCFFFFLGGIFLEGFFSLRHHFFDPLKKKNMAGLAFPAEQ